MKDEEKCSRSKESKRFPSRDSVRRAQTEKFQRNDISGGRAGIRGLGWEHRMKQTGDTTLPS